MSDSEQEATSGQSGSGPSRKKLKARSRSTSLSSIPISVVEGFLNIDMNDLIWNECHNIKDMFEFSKTEVPPQLMSDIFNWLCKKVKERYPSELMNETVKSSIFGEVLAIFAKYFREKCSFNNDQLQSHPELKLVCNGYKARLDYAFVHRSEGERQRAKNLADWFLFVVEANTEGPRYAKKQLLAYLDKVREMNPGLKVTKF